MIRGVFVRFAADAGVELVPLEDGPAPPAGVDVYTVVMIEVEVSI